MKKQGSYIIILIFLTVIFPLLFVVFTLFNFNSIRKSKAISESSSHILVIGQNKNINFLNNVYTGAKSVSERYDAIVELHAPSTKAEQSSLTSLFEYASFVNADGIIAYIDNDTEEIPVPRKSDGTEIPVVTVGNFDQKITQISFVGNNYSESGRILARTAVEAWKDGYNLYILNSEGTNPNYSNLMNTLSVTLKKARLYPEIIEGSENENQEVLAKKILHENSKPSVIICLTENDSIRTSQTASDPMYNTENIIISFGQNETISSYLKKGIIQTVISVDQVNTGTRAMKELFDYKKNNFANSYVYAGLQIEKGGQK